MTAIKLLHVICLGLFCTACSLTLSAPVPQPIALPSLEHQTFSPRIIYVENPRFPRLSDADLKIITQTAADLVAEHFGITMTIPATIRKVNIDALFVDLVAQAPDGFTNFMGDFRNGKMDWAAVRDLIAQPIKDEQTSLHDQIAFARPYLTVPLATDTADGLADAVTETLRTRISYWTKATLSDGAPIVGAVRGREDLPLNEYSYWRLMAKSGVEAEIVLTNQLVASAEYMLTPIHTAIRGGIKLGSAEYNPASKLGASVWTTAAPFLMDDAQINALKQNAHSGRDQALRHVALVLAHEIGHVALHLDHPWSNKACLMRPPEGFDFASWSERLDAQKCRVGSSAPMTPGDIRIWTW